MKVTGLLRVVLFIAVWAFGVFAWVRSLALLAKAAKCTEAGTHWWLRMNTFDPIIHPAVWTAEARAHWRRHLWWTAVFVACVGVGFLIGYLSNWPTQH